MVSSFSLVRSDLLLSQTLCRTWLSLASPKACSFVRSSLVMRLACVRPFPEKKQQRAKCDAGRHLFVMAYPDRMTAPQILVKAWDTDGHRACTNLY